ncbi:MAG: hypothetical protein HYS05_03375 [Acidobacteria bacterium]|nr:hypothetical protein [Acidobacteriota bacterium]
MTTLDNLRKAAKRWLKSLRDGEADARARLVRAHPGAPKQVTLRDVQHALARERGHESWIALGTITSDSSILASGSIAMRSVVAAVAT